MPSVARPSARRILSGIACSNGGHLRDSSTSLRSARNDKCLHLNNQPKEAYVP